MRRALAHAAVLAWGMWFGGLLVLFMSVSSVFATLSPDRKAAGGITAPIFHQFEKYQLVLAAVLVATLVGAWLGARRRVTGVAMGIAIAAAALALGNTLVITPKIDRGRETGQTQTAEFRQAHGMSMGMYSTTALLLFGVGLLLPKVISETYARPTSESSAAQG